MATTKTEGAFIECQVILETEKAIQIQKWFGESSNPIEAAKCKWVPKSCIISRDSYGVFVARWFIGKERMWDWTR